MHQTARGAPAPQQPEHCQSNPAEAAPLAAPRQPEGSGDSHSRAQAGPGQSDTAPQPTQPVGADNGHANIRNCRARAAHNPAARGGPPAPEKPSKGSGASHSRIQTTATVPRTAAKPAPPSRDGNGAAHLTGNVNKPADGARAFGTTAAQDFLQPTAPQPAAAGNTAAHKTAAPHAAALAEAAALDTLAAVRQAATRATAAATAATTAVNPTSIATASNQLAAGKQQHHSKSGSGPDQPRSSNLGEARRNNPGQFSSGMPAPAAQASSASKPSSAHGCNSSSGAFTGS